MVTITVIIAIVNVLDSSVLNQSHTSRARLGTPHAVREARCDPINKHLDALPVNVLGNGILYRFNRRKLRMV